MPELLSMASKADRINGSNMGAQDNSTGVQDKDVNVVFLFLSDKELNSTKKQTDSMPSDP